MANNTSNVLVPYEPPGVCFIPVRVFDPYNTNRPDSAHPTWTVLATVDALAATPTIVVNALVVWAVMGDGNLRSSVFNILLACAAVTDFLVGLLVEPLHCLFLACLINNCLVPECTFTAYGLSFLACSGFTVIAMTIACVERYLAIEHSNFYRKHVTGKRVLITTVISWIINMGILLTNLLLNRNHQKLLTVPGLVLMSTMVIIIACCSSKVQLTAYRQSKTIALQIASVQLPPDEKQQKEERLQEYKRVFTMTMLVVFSVLFYLPFITVTVIQAVKGKNVTSHFQYNAMPVCTTFVHLQSLINPLIMSLRLSYIRKGIKTKLRSLVYAD